MVRVPVSPPDFLVDISEETEAKMAAIRAYKSQFYDPQSEEPETFISSKRFLEGIETRTRYFGLRIGTEHAEPFLVREALPIDDPIAFFSDLDPSYILTTRGK